MKNVMVIGGAGFVGSNINLGNSDYKLISCDIRQTTAEAYIEKITQDITEVNASNIIARLNPEVLIVLAGRQFESPIQKKRNRVKSFSLNPQIAKAVVAITQSSSSIKKVIYVSTDMVYGKQESEIIDESFSPAPIGEYGKSKLEAERILSQIGENLIIVRPRLIVGAGRSGTLALLAKFIRMKLPVPIIGSGTNKYQMISVKDLWYAFDVLIRSDASGVFNIGSDNPPKLKDLLPETIHHLGKSNPILRLPRRLTEFALSVLDKANLSPLAPEQFMIAAQNCVLDTNKLRDLGWKPQYSDRDMLRETLEPLL